MLTTVTGCWTLTDLHDELALWEANCHTTTREEAEAYRDRLVASQGEDPDHDARTYTVYQAAGACYVISCSTCKALYDRGAHFGTSRHAITDATENEWALSGGRWACPDCKK